MNRAVTKIAEETVRPGLLRGIVTSGLRRTGGTLLLAACHRGMPVALGRSTPISGTARLLRLLVVVIVATVPIGCSGNLSCNDTPVLNALKLALDKLYAESRQVAKVDVQVRDLITVAQTPRQATCKAVTHITVEFFGTVQQDDPVINFVAEASDKGNVVVTIP